MKPGRRFLRNLGAVLLVVQVCSHAQKQVRIWKVGFLASRGRPKSLEADFYGELPRGLEELGYFEGRNLVIEWRFADAHYERLPGMASELIGLNVDVLVADGMKATLAAQNKTKTIPIVFGGVSGPVENGVVKSLGHPGGNTTGLALLVGDTVRKQLETLRVLLPGLARMAVLWNPANPSSQYAFENLRAAAQRVHIKVLSLQARTTAEIDDAFLRASDSRVAAMVVMPGLLITNSFPRIAALAATHRLPCVAGLREYVEAGGLMSYGTNHRYNYHRIATYVDKLFKGARPEDLPVEQPTKIELVINRRTASALGLTIPPELILLADTVIE